MRERKRADASASMYLPDPSFRPHTAAREHRRAIPRRNRRAKLGRVCELLTQGPNRSECFFGLRKYGVVWSTPSTCGFMRCYTARVGKAAEKSNPNSERSPGLPNVRLCIRRMSKRKYPELIDPPNFRLYIRHMRQRKLPAEKIRQQPHNKTGRTDARTNADPPPHKNNQSRPTAGRATP